MNGALEVLKNRSATMTPIWLMRQAGRYLPEYRAVRDAAGGFMEMALNPDYATEITLQPIRRFDMDVAIIFSDILILPHAFGRNLRFEEGVGPKLDPLDLSRFAAVWPEKPDDEPLQPICAAISAVRRALRADQSVFGFVGAPWTVATYVIAGGSDPECLKTRIAARKHPDAFDELLLRIADATADYLIAQIDAGANAVQIFESHGGSVPSDKFEDWVAAPTRRIVEKVRAAKPDTPIIGFPRGLGFHIPRYAEAVGVDALGVDHQTAIENLQNATPRDLPMQGALDPALLIAGGDALRQGVDRIMRIFKDRPHIFNLGHGVDKTTPPEHVVELVRHVREWEGR